MRGLLAVVAVVAGCIGGEDSNEGSRPDAGVDGDSDSDVDIECVTLFYKDCAGVQLCESTDGLDAEELEDQMNVATEGYCTDPQNWDGVPRWVCDAEGRSWHCTCWGNELANPPSSDLQCSEY